MHIDSRHSRRRRVRARSMMITLAVAVALSAPTAVSGATGTATGTAPPSRAAEPAGTVVDWGTQSAGSPPVGEGGVLDVRSSSGEVLALKADGTVVANSYAASSGLTPPASLRGVVAISVGFGTAAALRSDGSVVAWGQRAPSLAGTGTDNIGVAAGMGFVLVLKADHTVRGFGANTTGQTSVPVGLRDVVQVAASTSPGVSGTACGYSLALRSDGTVVAWGGAPYGGCGYYDNISVQPPPGLGSVVAVAAGSSSAVALRADGQAVSWGSTTQLPADWHDLVSLAEGGDSAIRSDGTVVSAEDTGSEPTNGLTSVTSVASSYSLGVAVRVPTPLGSPLVQTRPDTNPAGTAEAFRFTATASQPISNLTVYLDSTNAASRVQLGVYAAAGANPGALLASTTITAPVAGGWSRAALPSVTLTAGRTYWLALLAPKGAGKIKFRDRPDGLGGPTQTSAQTGLTDLPASWRTGSVFSNGPVSIFAGPTG